MPKVSVILPVYNTASYLPRCLNSLRRQTLQDIEIICVDDGSTDSSVRILHDLAAQDPRLQVIEGQHQTAGGARNTGLERASGDYIMFLDSDDFFEPHMLETLCTAADAQQLDIVVCNANNYIDETGEYEEVNYHLPEEFWASFQGAAFCPRQDAAHCLFQLVAGAPWNKMWNHNFIRRHQLRFQAITNSNDTFFTYAAFLHADRVNCVREHLVHWRVWSHSLSKGFAKHPNCFVTPLTELAKLLRTLPEEAQLRTSFTRVVTEITTWRCSQTPRELVPHMIQELQEKLGAVIPLQQRLEDFLKLPQTSQQPYLHAVALQLLRLIATDTLLLLPLNLRHRAAWKFLQKVPTLLPKNVEAALCILDLPEGTEARLQAIENDHRLRHCLHCYNKVQLDSDLNYLQTGHFTTIHAPGLFTSRSIPAEQLASAIRTLRPSDALSPITMRVLRHRKLRPLLAAHL